MASEGMPQIVHPNQWPIPDQFSASALRLVGLRQSSRFQDLHPRTAQRNARAILSGEKIRATAAFFHVNENRERSAIKRNMLDLLLLRVMRRFRPDSAFEIKMRPFGTQYLAGPRSRQNQEPDSVGGFLIGVFRKGLLKAA